MRNCWAVDPRAQTGAGGVTGAGVTTGAGNGAGAGFGAGAPGIEGHGAAPWTTIPPGQIRPDVAWGPAKAIAPAVNAKTVTITEHMYFINIPLPHKVGA